MRKLKICSLIIILSAISILKAEDGYFPVGNFIGGLSSFYSSLFISDNEVQEALNVYFDKDYAVTKREGFSLYGTTTTVRFYNSVAFTDSTNANWLIAISTQGIFASPGTGVFTVRIATVPAFNTSIVSAVNAFGRVYFVDTVQGVYYWDGTSTVYIGTTSPHGSLITEFHGRLWVAGLAIPNQNQLYASGFLNGSNWTTGSLSTDPVVLTVGLNDNYDGISAFFPGYNDTLYVFKKLSINGVYGFDQNDFEVRTLTKDAGCIDQGSIQPFRSSLVFVSQRGVELFDGFRTQLISKKIHDKIEPATFSSFAQRSWAIDSASEFQAGVITSSGIVDASNGSLTFRFPDYFNEYRNGSSGTLNVWTTYLSGSATGTVTANGTLNIQSNGNTLGRVNTRTTELMSDFKQGTTYHIRVVDFPTDPGNLSRFYLTFSTFVVSSPSNPDANPNWRFVFSSTEVNKASLDTASFFSGGSQVSVLVTTPSFTVPFTFDFFLATTTFSYSVNNAAINASTHSWPTNRIYMYLGFLYGPAASATLKLDDFEVAPQTFTFVSPVQSIGTSITSWGSFLASQDLGTGGNIVYQFCSDNNSAMSSPACAAQTPNSQITVAVDSFAQWSATFTTTGLTQQPILYSGITQWNEGGRRPRMASIYHDDRYFLSITTNTLSDGNDATLVLAQGLNGQLVWSMFDINSGTWVLYKNQVYHGDSNATGKFFLDNQGYTDNGNPITSYIITKDYAIDSILKEKIYKGIFLQAEGLGSFGINTSYFLDKEDTEFQISDSTQNEQGKFLNLFLPFPIDDNHQVFSKLIHFKFQNAENNAQMKLYGGILSYKSRPVLK